MVRVDDIRFEIQALSSPSIVSAREATPRKRPKTNSAPMHANNIMGGDTASTFTRPVSVQKATPRKRPKTKLWSYEIVAEPTGVTSKYWDVEAPTERATKKIANERLVATKDSNYDNQGSQTCPLHCGSLPQFQPYLFCFFRNQRWRNVTLL